MKKLLFTLLGIAGLCCTQGVAQPAFPISVAEGKLQYATDKQGNRILDFSYCGYRNSNELIPDAEVVYTHIGLVVFLLVIGLIGNYGV